MPDMIDYGAVRKVIEACRNSKSSFRPTAAQLRRAVIVLADEIEELAAAGLSNQGAFRTKTKKQRT